MYKTLGFKWLFEVSAPHQLLQRQTVTKPAIPNVLYMYPLHLEKVISKLEKTMNDSINAPDSDDYQKWRLSPISDYIIASDNKMYWLNGAYPYSNREFLKFIDGLKNNIDTTRFKGRIICLFGKDCENENVP
jgi:hypothetical protein